VPPGGRVIAIVAVSVGALGCGGGGGGKPDGALDAQPAADARDGGSDGIAADSGPTGGFRLPDPDPPGVRYQGRVVISPAAVTFTAMGESAVLRATAFDAAGAAVAGAVTWSSSRPEEVSVDAEGRVTSLTALGSAQITARVGDRVSAPVLVIVVEPQPDSVFVTDAQVVAGPEPVDAMAPLRSDGQVRLTVTGLPALQVGQLLLAREGKAVGGRVVSIADAAAGRAVVLQRVPLRDLFKRLKIQTANAIDEYALVTQEATAPTSTGSALRLGPFECELMGSLTGGFGIEPRLRVVPSLTFNLDLVKDENDDWSLVSVRLSGSVSASGHANVALMPGVSGSASCRGVLARVPLPVGGPLAAVISFQIPLGLKGEVDATLTSTELLAGLEVSSTGSVDMGFTYTPTGGVRETRDGSIDFRMKPKFEGPSSTVPFKVTYGAALGPFAGLDIGVTFLSFTGIGAVNLLDAAFLARLDGDLAFPDTQFGMPGYASAYEIKPEIEIAPGEDVAEALEFFGGALSLGGPVVIELSDPHPTSPTGMLTASTTTLAPGEMVELTAKLDAATLKFIGVDNLRDVYIYHRGPGGELERIENIPAGAGQTEFKAKWYPGPDDAGTNSFFAATNTYFAPFLPLEIAPSSKVDVEVVRRMNVWSGTVSIEVRTMGSETTMPTPTITATTTYNIVGSASLMLETEPGPIPEVPGPFKLIGGTASLSYNQTTVSRSSVEISIGPCDYPVTIGTTSDTRQGGTLDLDASFTGAIQVDPITGDYALIIGEPSVLATIVSETMQVSQGGGPSCPDAGPPNGSFTSMDSVRIEDSAISYSGRGTDPPNPRVVMGEETVMLPGFPPTTRTARWMFTLR
jgi:hypothetical protein